MSKYLRQSTASQSRALGPFLDDTDFKTAETALVIANTDIKLVVNGGASANKNSGGGTHRVNGVYGVTFDATDSATVGEMEVSVIVAGALPVFDKFTVIEEAVYDALFAASAAGYATTSSVSTATQRVTSVSSYNQAQKANHVPFSLVYNLSTAATTLDMVTVSTQQSLQHIIHVQSIRVIVITGSAGKTWTLRDKAASPVILSPAMDMGTTGVEVVYDFGPQGVVATQNKSVELLISAAGAAGIVVVEGFQKRTATAA